MDNEIKTRLHPETGETLERGFRPLLIAYKGLDETVNMPGWYPKTVMMAYSARRIEKFMAKPCVG